MAGRRVTPKISCIIPTLNESAQIEACLQPLQPYRDWLELILVDGGSEDETAQVARLWVDKVVVSPAGRALQMNAGAAQATGSLLLFLHIDTRLPASLETLRMLLHQPPCWGRFDVQIDNGKSWCRWVALGMSVRSRLTKICTGDQALFVTKSVFEHVGGYPKQPLMEDIALSRLLRAQPITFVPLSAKVCTSGRRWRKHGVLKTILRMWLWRLRYWLGASPFELAKEYGYVVSEKDYR